MSCRYGELGTALYTLIEVVMCKNGDSSSHKSVLCVEARNTVAFLVLRDSDFLDRMLIFVSSSCFLGYINNRKRRIKSKIIFNYTEA